MDGGTFATLYLAPKDYHRVHVPIDGEITGATYIPGELWPVNVHAVRQHWLVTKKPGTKNEYELPEKAKSFLVDLAELGATQFVPDPPDDPAKDTRLSSAASKVIDRRGGSKNRRKPQVISGAGLIASAAAIRPLPPFMKAPQMVGFTYANNRYAPMVIEGIGNPIDGPMGPTGLPIYRAVQITLATLTALDKNDVAGLFSRS